MNDGDFLRLLDEYLDPPADPNPEMAGLNVVWERDNASFGARHIWEKRYIAEKEVEEVLLEIPPYVEARRHPANPNRTIFWGATRHDRWILVVCETWQ